MQRVYEDKRGGVSYNGSFEMFFGRQGGSGWERVEDEVSGEHLGYVNRLIG